MLQVRSSRNILFAAAALLLLTSSAARADNEFFDIEPPSAKPKAPAEPPRPIRMEIEETENVEPKKGGRFSMFKHAAEPKKQIASNESVKDVPDENTKSGSGLSRVLSAPKTAAGVMCGLMVGVPVKAAKTMASETKRMNAQVSKDLTWGFDERKPDLGARVGAAVLSVPYGIATGLMTGLTKGTERAVSTGARKPLSKESMSISDPDLH